MTAFATEEKFSSIAEQQLYSIEEYLQMEERAKDKHEFCNGRIVAVPGVHHIHNQIAANITSALVLALYESKNYIVYNSDMKIFIPSVKTFVYPDAVVVCEKPELYNNRLDTILNPVLVVEVASASTADYDRTTKFWRYQSLPSFKEMVIVKQDMPLVKSFYKFAEHTWNDAEATQVYQSIFLRSINCNIELKRIYKNVAFPPQL